MKKVMAVLAAVSLVAFSVPAMAVSPSEAQCEALGGEFDRTQGEVTCVIATSDPVGNSESSGGKSQTRDTTTTSTGQGNSGNKSKSSSCTSGPGNSGGSC